MEDLGEAIENFVETFSCTEESRSRLPERAVPATHRNLLTASSLYGYLFAAVGSSIVVYSHVSLRNGDASPCAVVDLKEEHVSSIHALAQGAHDNIIAHVTTTLQSSIVILNIPALVAGKIHALPGPFGIVNAFSVNEMQSRGATQVLATLEATCVQLHNLTADGTTPMMKIRVANALCTALSPEGDLLAVGTERGNVVIYNAKTGETCQPIVEVESGWVPFSTHFADSRSILVSYNCKTEVRHVMWHISSDGATVEGHSPLGELCLASLPFDDDEPKEGPTHPTITCISLKDWNMCVIGSSMSSDVEIIRKTDCGWEVWKFDEGKSPTLPTDDNDDDTYCVGLAFDLNNTAFIPGPDTASKKINPMPRVIVYTSDSLLLPFALIDSDPGVKCDAVGNAAELPTIPASLRSIQSASVLNSAAPVPVNDPDAGIVTDAKDQSRIGQRNEKPPLRIHSQQELQTSSTAGKEDDHRGLLEAKSRGMHQRELTGANFETTKASRDTYASAKSEIGMKSAIRQKQSFKGVNSFLDNFSFKGASGEGPRPSTEAPPSFSNAMKSDRKSFESFGNTASQEKPKVSLATFLDLAEAEANGGDIFSLLKSIVTEMSEELRVSAEAEQIISEEIATQKDTIVSSIAKSRQELIRLLQLVRTLFQNEATLRNSVSSTLSKILSLSREYEKISLEFHVKEADKFSRSVRAEEKEFDDKIASKEAEVLRSIASIEDRLNAEAEIQSRRNPAEFMQQVYSSLSLQGIRIKRVRSLFAALCERMDNQDKGGRLSHLGLSLARLEKLNIRDDDIPYQSPHLDKNRRRESVGEEVIGSLANMMNVVSSQATSNIGDESQLLPSDVQAVMRRLAMSGGRASIRVSVPQPHAKRGRINKAKEEFSVSDVLGNQTMTRNKSNGAGLESSEVPSHSLSVSKNAGFGDVTGGSSINAESMIAPEASTFSRPNEISEADTSRTVLYSRTLETKGQETCLHSAIPSKVQEVRNGNTRLKTSTLPVVSQPLRSQGGSTDEVVPSASLPPKKPPNQTLLPSSTERNNLSSSLLSAIVFGEKEQKRHSELSSEPSSLPHAKRRGSDNGHITETSKTEEEVREGLSSSTPLANSASNTTAPTTSTSEVFGLQTSNFLSGNAGAKGSSESGAVQFAHLPPDDSEGKQKPSTTASTPQFASLPPEDSEVEQKPAIASSTPISATNADTLKNAPRPGFLATLPPDTDSEPISEPSSDNKTEAPLLSQAQESRKATTVPGLFATLPPDPETEDAGRQRKGDSEKGGNVSLPDSSKFESSDRPAIPPTKTELPGTSDLFAALPPDDTSTKQMQQTAANKNGGNPLAAEPVTSTFADGVDNVNIASSNIPFGMPEQSAPAFGSASLFGAGSSGNQSATPMPAPERKSESDGTSSDESETETRRFGGGMDTSSGESYLVGSLTAVEGSKQKFGFGSNEGSTSASTAFGQYNINPFTSVGQSQPFGQATLSQPSSQTSFASLAGSQGNMSSAFQSTQPAFGATSAFGAVSASPAFSMDSTFGVTSQLGASSSFGVQSQLGMGSAPFGSPNPTFGGSVSTSGFGESSFGMTSSFGSFSQNSAGNGSGNNPAGNSAGSGFGSNSGGSSVSPFGNVVSGGGFGGASTGGSGFAALVGGQSGNLVFGNGSGPPSFTSAAFSQRRA